MDTIEREELIKRIKASPKVMNLLWGSGNTIPEINEDNHIITLSTMYCIECESLVHNNKGYVTCFCLADWESINLDKHPDKKLTSWENVQAVIIEASEETNDNKTNN